MPSRHSSSFITEVLGDEDNGKDVQDDDERCCCDGQFVAPGDREAGAIKPPVVVTLHSLQGPISTDLPLPRSSPLICCSFESVTLADDDEGASGVHEEDCSLTVV